MARQNLNTASARKFLFRLGIFLSLASSATPSVAAGPASFAKDLADAVHSISEGGPSLAPFAHVRFCVGNPDQCIDTGGDATVEFSRQRRDELTRINAQVNRAIRPRHDAAGKDNWRVDVASGDCEDYALTKRKRLLLQGWSSRALRIAVVVTRFGEGHAVLVVKTTAGDLVLDNRFDEVKDWRSTDLRWVKIQSGKNPKLWFDLERRNSPPVALVSSNVRDNGSAGAEGQNKAWPIANDKAGIEVSAAARGERQVASAVVPATFKTRPGSVIRVVDGATFELAGVRYRLDGINAGGRNEICRDAGGRRYACGLRKAKALSDMLRNAVVTCRVEQASGGMNLARCEIEGRSIAEML